MQAQLKVQINFSDGPSFNPPFYLGTSKLGEAALASTTTVIADVSDQVRQTAIRRTYSRVTDTWNPGYVTISFVDETGDFNPENTSGPYYGKIKPMRKLILQWKNAGDPYGSWLPLWAGYIQSWKYTPANGADVAKMEVLAYDGFLLFNNANITTVAGAVAGETAGPRINAILNQIGWPSTMRSISTGKTTLQADPGTLRTTLNALQTVEESEYGALYMDVDGKVRFDDRAYLFYDTYSAITGEHFKDYPPYGGGYGYPYTAVDFALDDVMIQNAVTVTPAGMTPQYAENAASISTYFTHSVARENLLMNTTADALNQANAIVAARAYDQLRIDGFTCDITNADVNNTNAVMGTKLLDYVRVERTAPGQTIDQRLLVHGISHDITPNRWVVKFQTLEPVITGFVLGNPDWGKLGTNVLGPY